jgi:hypothetical protein
MVAITAGRDAVLELTADNAEVEAVTAAATSAATPLETDPWSVLTKWRDSVIAIWSPTARASGFVIDASGTIATNQRAIGTATAVEVQLSPGVKVAASVLVADPVQDVAILRIDPKVAASVAAVPLGCGEASKPTVVVGEEIYTIGVPFRQPKNLTSATVSRVARRDIESDFVLASGSAGGPVFNAAGLVVGITSVGDGQNATRNGDARVVRIDAACDVVASAVKKAKDAAPPAGTLLPMEPAKPFPVEALTNAARTRAGSLSPYQIASADFDINFITPVMTYAVEYQSEQARARERGRGSRTPEPAYVRPLMNFSNWSEYVAEFPPVLLVRATPRLVESFWTKVARGAAQTQGVSLPPIKRFTSGFSRMRAFCGDVEVTPIHPFTLEQRVSETDAIREGLYVFDPGALGPHCATVRLVLHSEKEPEKGDTRTVDPKVIQQIWEDFAPFRAEK